MKNKKSDKSNMQGNAQNNFSNAAGSISDDTKNKNHNAKKAGMGPNTSR